MMQDQSWMVEDVTSVRGVRHAVVLSSDGLPVVRSRDTDAETADRLAAACSGLQSLGRSLAQEFGRGSGAVHQQMVEWDGGFLFVRSAGTGSHLAVVTEAVVDPALVAQQMQAQILKIGERALSTPARQGTGA
ncbi:roadblock/LC7 domain-containing protein [Streptomyces sp. NPDC059637]